LFVTRKKDLLRRQRIQKGATKGCMIWIQTERLVELRGPQWPQEHGSTSTDVMQTPQPANQLAPTACKQKQSVLRQ